MSAVVGSELYAAISPRAHTKTKPELYAAMIPRQPIMLALRLHGKRFTCEFSELGG